MLVLVIGTLQERERIVAQYVGGDGVESISRDYGVHHSVVKAELVAAGVQLRGRAEAAVVRDARLDGEARRRRTAAATAASVARRRRPETLCAQARAIEAAGRPGSPYEEMLATWLRARGLALVPQQAIGPYNCDLGAAPVAIEVLGSVAGLHGAKLESRARRVLHFLESGWHVLLVLCVAGPGKSIAEPVMTQREELVRLAPGRREWRILDGAGAVVASGGPEAGKDGLKVALAHCRRLLKRRA